MDVATMKKDLENQIGSINEDLKNIYLPLDAVLILQGKRTAFRIALELIGSLQQEQPVEGLEEEIDNYIENERYFPDDERPIVMEIARHFAEWGKKHLKK